MSKIAVKNFLYILSYQQIPVMKKKWQGSKELHFITGKKECGLCWGLNDILQYKPGVVLSLTFVYGIVQALQPLMHFPFK